MASNDKGPTPHPSSRPTYIGSRPWREVSKSVTKMGYQIPQACQILTAFMPAYSHDSTWWGRRSCWGCTWFLEAKLCGWEGRLIRQKMTTQVVLWDEVEDEVSTIGSGSSTNTRHLIKLLCWWAFSNPPFFVSRTDLGHRIQIPRRPSFSSWASGFENRKECYRCASPWFSPTSEFLFLTFFIYRIGSQEN